MNNSVTSLVGNVILATLLVPTIFHNDASHNSFGIIVHAQVEDVNTATFNLRGRMLQYEEEQMMEEEEPENLDLVEGMMSSVEGEDDGGLVMAHSYQGLPESEGTAAIENAQSEEEALDGFINSLVPEENTEMDSPLSNEEGPIPDQLGESGQPFMPEEGGMMHPPSLSENGQFLEQPPQPPGQPEFFRDELLSPSDTVVETPGLPLSELVPPGELSDIEGQMGPVPEQNHHVTLPSPGGAYPELNMSTPPEQNNPQQPPTEDTSTQGFKFPFSKDSCPIPAPKTATLEPTMVASYPGSGAKLTWKLIRAVSGYMTSDDAVDQNDLSKNKQVIAIKTHYPARGSSDDFFAPFIDVPTSILLLRNPFNAIPSFLSFLYEQSQNLTGHSVRAPLDVWISWRDRHFEHEMELWVSHARFWMRHHEFDNRMILPYEYLIKPGSGPTELRKVRTFLEKNAQIEMRTPVEKVACIWDYIVMKREDQGTKVGSMRKGGPKIYPYTAAQLNIMTEALDGLKKEFPGELGSLMELYIYQIKEAQTAASYT